MQLGLLVWGLSNTIHQALTHEEVSYQAVHDKSNIKKNNKKWHKDFEKQLFNELGDFLKHPRNIWYSPLTTVTRQIDPIRCVHPWCPWQQHCCTPHLVPPWWLPTLGHHLLPHTIFSVLLQCHLWALILHILSTALLNSHARISSHLSRALFTLWVRFHKEFQYTANCALVCSQEENASPN